MTTQRIPRSILALAAAFALAAPLVASAPVSAAGNPEAAAQQFVYELNLARWSPVLFKQASGVAMPVVPAMPPVAPQPALFASAMFKANEMSDYGYFSHQSPVTGVWPNGLVRSYGFPIPANWPDDENFLESIEAGSTDPYDVVKAFAASPSHRVHVFGEGGFGGYFDIGVGRSSANAYWAIHLTAAANPTPSVTGVVYDDLDGNGRMDLGEGLPGVTVFTPTDTTTTNAGGGYALPLPATGATTVAATIDDVTTRATFTASGYSVGVDFTRGADRAVVRAYELCDGLQPTILGTDGDDVITGTSGPDVIAGLDGDDVIDGLGGDDIICGGSGNDRIAGGPGNDTIFGGPGNDRLKGGGGVDWIAGEAGRDHLSGGGANDVLEGGGAGDRIKGQAGDDLLRGGSGIDTGNGGRGLDTCIATETRLDCEG